MGEAADYEQMFTDMESARSARHAAQQSEWEQETLQREKAYEGMPKGGWQSGCPFEIGDIAQNKVSKTECIIIGLPTRQEVADKRTIHADKAWCKLSSGIRIWLPWSDLQPLRRSPPRAKSAARESTGSTIQTKLFEASRTKRLRPEGADDDSPTALPREAAIERDRAPSTKPPAGVRGHQREARVTPQTEVPIPRRLAQYPDQGFRDSAHTLFCGPCLAVIPNIKSSIDSHIATNKHIAKLAAFNSRTTEDVNLMIELGSYFKDNPQLTGTGVSESDQLYRYRVTEAFQSAGIPIAKVNMLRSLLQRSGQAMTHSSHLKMYLPMIEAHELDRLIKEMVDMLFTIIFDSTTRIGELFNAVARWCSFDFYIVQRLICLRTFASHLKAPEVAAFLTQHLLTQLKVLITQLVGFIRDSCSVNGAAVRTLSTTFTAAQDMLCLCHTLNHLGAHFKLDLLDCFTSAWIKLIYSSRQAYEIWRAAIGTRVVGYSAVRWHATAEIQFQLGENFTLISPTINRFVAEGIGATLSPRLRTIYDSDPQLLHLQLAAMMDMKPVVQTTYALEGDGLPIMVAFERIEALRSLGRQLAVPGILTNVTAVLRQSSALAVGTPVKKHWDGYGVCDGKIATIGQANSTLYPGQIRTAYTVLYPIDDTRED